MPIIEPIPTDQLAEGPRRIIEDGVAGQVDSRHEAGSQTTSA